MAEKADKPKPDTPPPVIDKADKPDQADKVECVHRRTAMFSRGGVITYRCLARIQCKLSDCRVCAQRRELPTATPTRPRVVKSGQAPGGPPLPKNWACPHRSAEPHAEVHCTACGRGQEREAVFHCNLYATDCTLRKYARGRQVERICADCPDLPDNLEWAKEQAATQNQQGTNGPA